MSTGGEGHRMPGEPDKVFGIDAEYLSGRRFPYQEDISLVADIDLMAATPGGACLGAGHFADVLRRRLLASHAAMSLGR